MNETTNLDEKRLQRRKAMVIGMIALTVSIMIGFTFGSWRFLQDMGDFLEQDLGARLLSVATLTAEVTQSGEFAAEIASGRGALVSAPLNDILSNIHVENRLQGIYLVDESYRTIASSQGLFSHADRLTFIEEDSTVFLQALAGAPAVSELQVVAGNRFKNAYAPVFGPFNEVVAVVVVQASAEFFDLMRDFQRGMILGGVVSVALVVIFSVFLFWAISLLIKTNESLRQSERLAAMGQMAATVAHEIRNPLGIIKGTADVLKSKYDNQDAPDELFEYIPSEVRRLNRLVSDFLTFARDRDLERNATDLAYSVEKSLDSLQDEVRQANIRLERDFDPLPEVRHDEDAINQIILNLTLNAVQAMNGTGGAISVRLKNDKRRKGRAYVRVVIEDTGCGFDVDTNKIFEPFYTTKTSGSGLGLAICKRLVEKHDGWIEVQSEKGEGTKMQCYLPVAD